MFGLCTHNSIVGTSAITSDIRTVLLTLWSQQSADSKLLANKYYVFLFSCLKSLRSAIGWQVRKKEAKEEEAEKVEEAVKAKKGQK